MSVYSGDSNREYGTHLLLDSVYAAEGSALATLADFFVRFEDMSHCLIWTGTFWHILVSPFHPCVSANVHSPPGTEVSVDLVELPRLNLSFCTKLGLDGAPKLYCNEHMGMFISSTRDERVSNTAFCSSFSLSSFAAVPTPSRSSPLHGA